MRDAWKHAVAQSPWKRVGGGAKSAGTMGTGDDDRDDDARGGGAWGGGDDDDCWWEVLGGLGAVWGQRCLGSALFGVNAVWGQRCVVSALFGVNAVWGQRCSGSTLTSHFGAMRLKRKCKAPRKPRATLCYPWARSDDRGLWCAICEEKGVIVKPCTSRETKRKTFWLRRHANSTCHKNAEKSANPTAPSEQSFKTVYEAVRKGMSAGDNGLASVGNKEKVRNMIYCLGEAAKRHGQKFLLKAESITLFRDARKNRLCIRYTASRTGFKVQSGVLGWCRQDGLSSKCIAKDTARIMAEFCTSYARGPCPERHRELRKRIRDRVHQVVVDSAADELLAGEIGTREVSSDLRPITPNCRVILRDKAHAARRPLNRPWTRLPFLKELIERWISSRPSPARMIQNSFEFRRWFKKNLEADSQRRISDFANLRAAKHRFESVTKPLQRSCFHCRSLLRTMVQIANC